MKKKVYTKRMSRTAFIKWRQRKGTENGNWRKAAKKLAIRLGL